MCECEFEVGCGTKHIIYSMKQSDDINGSLGGTRISGRHRRRVAYTRRIVVRRPPPLDLPEVPGSEGNLLSSPGMTPPPPSGGRPPRLHVMDEDEHGDDGGTNPPSVHGDMDVIGDPGRGDSENGNVSTGGDENRDESDDDDESNMYTRLITIAIVDNGADSEDEIVSDIFHTVSNQSGTDTIGVASVGNDSREPESYTRVELKLPYAFAFNIRKWVLYYMVRLMHYAVIQIGVIPTDNELVAIGRGIDSIIDMYATALENINGNTIENLSTLFRCNNAISILLMWVTVRVLGTGYDINNDIIVRLVHSATFIQHGLTIDFKVGIRPGSVRTNHADDN